ncbi:MAG: N-acetylmuramoyl-L-alanine amidase [Candidatus Wallbacteria bacterium]|nr:N-acetylmuramoyl-L-alanine amidase [Candidatus Wallbacteria bacterium]
MLQPIILFLIFVFVPPSHAGDTITFGHYEALDNELLLNFHISWKRNYCKTIADPEEPFICIDIPKLFVLKSETVEIKKNVLVESVKLSQFEGDTARVVIRLRGKSKNFICSTFFKTEGSRTTLVMSVKPKDKIGEIIQENSFVVVVDPGHGGIDPGCISRKKVKEKSVVLVVAKQIETEFKKRDLGIIVLTRKEDILLSLDERMKRAVDNKASLFISLHIDSYPQGKYIKGVGIYYLSQKGASDKRSELLAQEENSADEIGGIKRSENQELYQILFSLKQTESIKRSATFSGILKEKLEDRMVNAHGILQANFRVLKIPDMPAVLAEVGFFSNQSDEKLLVNDAYQKRMAKAIVDAIEEYRDNWWKKRY